MMPDIDENWNKALICRLARSLAWTLRALDDEDVFDLTPGWCEAVAALKAVTEEHGTGWDAPEAK